MIKNLFLLMIFAASLVFSSCEKEDNNPETNNPQNTIEAEAEHDTKSGGIYKGVLVGSSGYFKIVLQKDTAMAVVIFDGVTRTLTSTSLDTWASGQAITNVVFSSADWTLTFSVDSNGENPAVNVSIPNHTLVTTTEKETSTSELHAFEGSYTGDSYGVFNFILKNGVVKGQSKSGEGFGVSEITGNVNDKNEFTGSLSNGVTLAGSISGDNCSGTWSQAVQGTTINGQFTAKKKL